MKIRVDGREVEVDAGITLAAALLNIGNPAARRSLGGSPRGPLCGMGTCFECRVTLGDERHVRSCVVPVRDGMRVRTDG